MDKTHNISLGGFAFAIDDAAYNILKRYLSDIRHSLHNTEGVDEIIADVEFRMAELLRQRMSSREVVNRDDVDHLISVMGKPEDFYTEEFLEEEERGEEAGARAGQTYSARYEKTGKKLFRDPDNKMLGGVCSGLAHYFGIDATWMRLIVLVLPFLDMVFLGISTSFVVVTYFVLWLVVPEAKTTSDKLQMRGEPVNFDSIKDFFGNSPETVRNNLKDFGSDARRVANNSGSVIGNLLRAIIKVIGFIFIAFLLIIAISLLIAFTAAIIGLGGAFFGVGIAGFALGDYFPYLFEGDWEQWVAYISLALVMVLPAVALILLVLRLISSRYRVPRAVAFSLPLLWFLGLIGLAVVGVSTAAHFRSNAKEVKTVNLPTTAQTLVMQMQDDERDWDSDDILSVRPGYLALEKDNEIKVKKSETGNAYLELKYYAKGKTGADAAQNLKNIDYKYEVQDSLVKFDEHVFVKEGTKWRNQEVEITLYLPESKRVKFNNLDVESYQNGDNDGWHDTKPENIYTFEDGKFSCVNCPGNVTETKNTEDQDTVSANNGVIKIKTEEDSIIINTNKNGTGNISITTETDSISD